MSGSSGIRLGVNVDHSATLRQARYPHMANSMSAMVEPDPLEIAREAERGGADGITIHLREDRRHILDEDVRRIRDGIDTRLNLEMACTSEMIRIAAAVAPDAVCLVPENRAEVTTEGGLDLEGRGEAVAEVVRGLRSSGIRLSFFIDPEPSGVEKAARLGAAVVELHTGAFAHAFAAGDAAAELERLRVAAEAAHRLGLEVHAGHGINYRNVSEACGLPHVAELNIGHTILARSLGVGMRRAVGEMREAMDGASS